MTAVLPDPALPTMTAPRPSQLRVFLRTSSRRVKSQSRPTKGVSVVTPGTSNRSGFSMMSACLNASPSFSSDELEIVEGSILGNHYKVEAFLGEGGFGIVAKCCDTKTNQAVAIKVNKNRTNILQQAKKEIFILEQLRRLDPDAANIVKWNDYIRDPDNRRLPISEVRPILGQLTNALSHLGSLGIVHADLKPGNIMVVNRYESPVKVKLIDFGLACPASAVMPGDRVGTVGYSAPEVMVGLPYNKACDMWSLGLVAVELVTGVPLYPGKKYYDVFKFIIETQGQPPDHVLDPGVYTEDYFTKDNYNYNQQRWTFKTAQQFKYETGYESLETRYMKLRRLDDLEQIMIRCSSHLADQIPF
uniref:Homeodomain-interacting protein kinase 2-like n=1 Tax=Haplochromis burtoni TaxID=8153 RepID=A0A3Q3CIQ6_HAPBU